MKRKKKKKQKISRKSEERAGRQNFHVLLPFSAQSHHFSICRSFVVGCETIEHQNIRRHTHEGAWFVLAAVGCWGVFGDVHCHTSTTRWRYSSSWSPCFSVGYVHEKQFRLFLTLARQNLLISYFPKAQTILGITMVLILVRTTGVPTVYHSTGQRSCLLSKLWPRTE